MTEVTPHPLKTQGFHNYLILLFYDHPAETPCFFVLKESALQLLADLGSLTDAAAQVIQLGAANISAFPTASQPQPQSSHM